VKRHQHPIVANTDIIAAEWSDGTSDIEGKVTREERESVGSERVSNIEDLQAALAQFAEIANDLKR
jgi:hypothetical protein